MLYTPFADNVERHFTRLKRPVSERERRQGGSAGGGGEVGGAEREREREREREKKKKIERERKRQERGNETERVRDMRERDREFSKEIAPRVLVHINCSRNWLTMLAFRNIYTCVCVFEYIHMNI